MSATDYLSDSAVRAIALASAAAREAGHEQIECDDLLVGLFRQETGIAAATLRALDVHADAVRTQIAAGARLPALRPPAPGRAPGTTLGADARAVFTAATSGAIADGDEAVTTGSLLHALARHLALPADAVLAELARQRVSDTGGELAAVNAASATLAAIRLGPPPGPPRRAAVWVRMIAPLAVYAALGTAVAARDEWDLAVFVLVAMPATLLLLGPLLGRAARRRIAARMDHRAPRHLHTPTDLAETAARYGIATLEIRLHQRGALRNWSARSGRRGWIVLGRDTVRQAHVLPAVLAHESAHIVRDDASLLRMVHVMCLGLVYAGIVTFSLAGAATGVAAAIVLFAVSHWWIELSCDALAIRWVGRSDGLGEFLTGHRRAQRIPEARNPRGYLRRALAVLTHPTFRIRMARASAVGRRATAG